LYFGLIDIISRSIIITLSAIIILFVVILAGIDFWSPISLKGTILYYCRQRVSL
jgi:hypothetical protein